MSHHLGWLNSNKTARIQRANCTKCTGYYVAFYVRLAKSVEWVMAGTKGAHKRNRLCRRRQWLAMVGKTLLCDRRCHIDKRKYLCVPIWWAEPSFSLFSIVFLTFVSEFCIRKMFRPKKKNDGVAHAFVVQYRPPQERIKCIENSKHK